MNKLPLAKEMSYWKTSKSGVEGWIEKTTKLIDSIGGSVHTELVGMINGTKGILIGFKVLGVEFRITWPVLPVENDKDKAAALRQCATFVYHDTKNRVNKLKIFPPEVVFSDWLVLGSGKTLAESNELNELTKLIE